MLVRSVNIFVISVVDADLLEVGVWHVEVAFVDYAVEWVSVRIGVGQVVGTVQSADVVLALLPLVAVFAFRCSVGRYDHVDLVGLSSVLASGKEVSLGETVVGVSGTDLKQCNFDFSKKQISMRRLTVEKLL